ncbi:DUF2793 domain-containing protein [Jhaorihella thermophila]|uniref:DUF2793 domain-containing protein n=1 Tax=Jhaorihella thermophila TaxID=488547 RepID=A0A1H5Y711_9RHOB|nr:DUF2793 domain-containing protein [Jhaorihella thermophila]SEG19783.1 Protein of unknown function [Jhaorihella thermophila]
MTDLSPRLGLPYLLPSQAQKHVTHNEALRLLDALVQLTVESFEALTPPASPADGECHALGAAPTGEWAGQEGRIALRETGRWRFIDPQPGWLAWGRDGSGLRVYDSGGWMPVPVGVEQVDRLGISTAPDAVNKLAVAADATLLTHAGTSHQLKVNKAAAGDTASLLFQSGWTGHAEMGLSGSDDFSIKVSSDGATWRQALTVDAATGFMGLWEAATPGSALEVAQNAVEPTITVRNTGGSGGASFRMVDAASLGDWKAGITAGGDFRLRDQRAGQDCIHISTDTGHVGISNTSPTAPLDVGGGVRLGSSTVATLPSAADLGAGTLIYVSDESGGPVIAFSDGTNWRRMTDRAVVS